MRITASLMFSFYTIGVFTLVFLPLPDAQTVASLSEYRHQLIPFHFVADVIRETPFEIENIHTYIPALFNRAVLQVVYNVVMMIPMGIFVKYYFNVKNITTILVVFAVSLFIEITQLTGIYGIYNGSYRLCDVDDLIANTLGGAFGCFILNVCTSKFLPGMEYFTLHMKEKVYPMKNKP